jgi:hypothetical protein
MSEKMAEIVWQLSGKPLKQQSSFVDVYVMRLVIGSACTVRRREVPRLRCLLLAVKKNMGKMGVSRLPVVLNK